MNSASRPNASVRCPGAPLKFCAIIFSRVFEETTLHNMSTANLTELQVR